MKMTVENESGSTFSIDIGLQDTVLTFKRKIEMTQRIPVSRQTIFFQGKLLEDHLDIFEWDILQNPLLHLSISPDDNPTQNQVPQSPSNPIPDPLTTENFSKNQHDRPVITKMVPELLGPQGTSPVTVGRRRNRDQEVKNRVSSSSDSVKEVINIPDTPARKKTKNYPLKITVMVQPFKETRRIQVEVNVLSNVEVLRKELVKMQERGELNLPHEGFFFIHKQDVLREDQSFMANRVAPGDTIEIFQGYVTYTGSLPRTVRKLSSS
ncbi:Ubiquitin domain [Arabidopsis suecica]|uniref:Ubiquitin domain n=1 Tax=Arabidopsis suecica TaxID=45249 RepID=A0A8T2E5U0_ARASU|nr:Ubiquitin domain [Arabidopsis suecica]